MAQVNELIAEVVKKSTAINGKCLFRGEPKRYPIVSSGLYRTSEDCKNESFDMGRMEEEIVAEAESYTALERKDEILAELQHYGGKTNLIDFTDDYLIALFFACEKYAECDGRIVLHCPDDKSKVNPRYTNNRVVSQKSVLVRPSRGFLVPDDEDEVVVVPSQLKAVLLEYLSDLHGISERSVYSDIYGYIRHQNPKRSSYMVEFNEARAALEPFRGEEVEAALEEGRAVLQNIPGTRVWYQRGMSYLDRNPNITIVGIEVPQDDRGPKPFYVWVTPSELANLYANRIATESNIEPLVRAHCGHGEALLLQDELEGAGVDFENALKLDPVSAQAYLGRAHLLAQQGKHDDALSEIEEALELRPHTPPVFMDRGLIQLQNGCATAALSDFDIAIIQSSDQYVEVRGRDGFFFRGVARCFVNDWDEAKSDLEEARNKGVLIASSFQRVFGGIEQFEREHQVRLPSSIRTLLYLDDRS